MPTPGFSLRSLLPNLLQCEELLTNYPATGSRISTASKVVPQVASLRCLVTLMRTVTNLLDIGSLDKDAPNVPRERKETETFISPLECG